MDSDNRFIQLLNGATEAIVRDLFESIGLTEDEVPAPIRLALVEDATMAAWSVLHSGTKGYIEGLRSGL